MSGHNKTEKATPKKREDARKKGQVARSADLNGAAVMLAALLTLTLMGPQIMERLQRSMRHTLGLIADPELVTGPGLAALLGDTAAATALAVAPVAAACLIGGVLASVAQVRFRITPKALKPDPKRLNPLQGAKNIFGPNAMFEGVKAVTKIAVIGGVAAAALLPELDDLAALVGMPVSELLAMTADIVMGICWRAGLAYLVIAVADVAWQRHRFAKQLRMDKEEVKREQKEQTLPPELKAVIRRRQMQAARTRMMGAVPTADVVVTNPTHFSVALKYDGSMTAPEVVAKGQDLVALQIRRLAGEHGVPVVADPPLARSLHRSVEVGQQIPEELFGAVAQVLAFVYRTANRRAG